MYDKVRMMMSRTRGDGDITRYLDNAKEQTDLKRVRFAPMAATMA